MTRLSDINNKIILYIKTIIVRQAEDPKSHSRVEPFDHLLISQVTLVQVFWNSNDWANVCCCHRYRLAITNTEFSHLNSHIPTPYRNTHGSQSSESTRLGIVRFGCDFFKEKDQIGNCVTRGVLQRICWRRPLLWKCHTFSELTRKYGWIYAYKEIPALPCADFRWTHKFWTYLRADTLHGTSTKSEDKCGKYRSIFIYGHQ
jgi:hypothetical protein